MKRILVPTDFSEEAEHALKLAVQLAKKNDGEIFLMNMLDLPFRATTAVTDSKGGELPEAMFFMRLAHQRFSKLLEEDFLKGVKVTDTVEFRSAFDGIIDGVKKHNIDLIVMGSSGASGVKEIFIGSNTEKVVRNSEIPVLVIKDEIPDFEVKDFVFATDFMPHGKDAFLRALRFTESYGAHMHLVYINTPSKFRTTKEVEARYAEFLKGVTYKNITTDIYNDQSIEKGIMNYTDKMHAQLMGIATTGRKGLAHLLNGSISEDLVNHSAKPVITFKV